MPEATTFSTSFENISNLVRELSVILDEHDFEANPSQPRVIVGDYNSELLVALAVAPDELLQEEPMMHAGAQFLTENLPAELDLLAIVLAVFCLEGEEVEAQTMLITYAAALLLDPADPVVYTTVALLKALTAPEIIDLGDLNPEPDVV